MQDLSFLSSQSEHHLLKALYQSSQQFPLKVCFLGLFVFDWVLSFHLLYLFTFLLKLIPK